MDSMVRGFGWGIGSAIARSLVNAGKYDENDMKLNPSQSVVDGNILLVGSHYEFTTRSPRVYHDATTSFASYEPRGNSPSCTSLHTSRD
jgi:hypothetical protein